MCSEGLLSGRTGYFYNYWIVYLSPAPCPLSSGDVCDFYTRLLVEPFQQLYFWPMSERVLFCGWFIYAQCETKPKSKRIRIIKFLSGVSPSVSKEVGGANANRWIVHLQYWVRSISQCFTLWTDTHTFLLSQTFSTYYILNNFSVIVYVYSAYLRAKF